MIMSALFLSCTNNYKRDIIGEWEYSENKIDKKGRLESKYDLWKFSEDGNYEDISVIVAAGLPFSITSKGEYEIKGDSIILHEKIGGFGGHNFVSDRRWGLEIQKLNEKDFHYEVNDTTIKNLVRKPQ